MDLVIQILAVVLGVIGIAGCIIPVIPGPPFSWGGLLLLYIWGSGDEMSLRFLIIWLIVTVVVTVLDYVVPSYFTKVSGGSKAAARGSLVGMLIGIIFFPPLGMIIGAFLGALLCEVLVNGRKLGHSIKPALGSFLGFLCGTFMKLVASGVMMYWIVKYL